MADNARVNILLRYVAEDRDFNRTTDRVKKRLGGISSSFKQIRNFALGAFGGQVLIEATRGLGNMVKRAASLATTFEQTAVSFEVFTGSLEAAKALIIELDDFSVKTPFEPQEIQATAKTLLGFGRDVSGIKDDLFTLGNVAAATGSDLKSLGVVFGQVAGLGRLQGQDALQFISQGIPIYQILAESMGKSTAELKKLQEQGKITFEDVNKAFKEASEEGGKFENALLKQSQTVGGLLSTFRGAFAEVLKQSGQIFLPFFKTVLIPLNNQLFRIVEFFRNNAPEIQARAQQVFGTIGNVIGFVKTSLEIILEPFRRLFSTIRGLLGSSGFGGFGPVLDKFAQASRVAANVIALLVDGLNAFFGLFRGGGSILGRFVQNRLGGLVQRLSDLPKTINGIVHVVRALDTVFSNTFERIRLSARGFIADLGSLFSRQNLLKILSGNFSALNFAAGDLFRSQRDQIKSGGKVVVEAFQEGMDEVDEVKFPIAELQTFEAEEEFKGFTKALVDETKGAGEKINKELQKAIEKAKDNIAKLKETLEDLQLEASVDAAVLDLEQLRLDAQRQIDALVGTPEQIKEQSKLIRDILQLEFDKIFKERNKRLQEEEADEANKLAKTLLGDIENEAAIIERELERALDTEKPLKLRKEFVAELKKQAEDALDIARNLTNNLLEEAISRKDKEIAIQQERLSEARRMAEEGSAEQLQIEEERLRKLQQEREQAIQRQRQLAAIEISIQNAVAIANQIAGISKAVNQPFPLNIAAVALTVATIAAQTASIISNLSNAFGSIPAFEEGTEYFRPGKGNAGMALLHEGEGVLTREQNQQIRKFGITYDQIPELVEKGLILRRGELAKIGQRKIDSEIRQGGSDKKLINELRENNKILRNQNNQIIKQYKHLSKAIQGIQISQVIDRKGVSQMVKTIQQKESKIKTLQQ